MNKITKVQVKNKIVSLSDDNYKAAGGQGIVFVKDSLAYKIYHDSKNMIPIAKIQELSQLQHNEILSPNDIIYNTSNTPIGFTMKFVEDTEFLCKLFTKTFKQDKNLKPQDIVKIVARMQETLEYIHSKNILVVDYNEMNFLLSEDFKSIYHIDVDSWQTKSFPAVALMESVRDRKIKKFSMSSDWFSFAIVTFQIYIGIHPFKGMHPKFKPSEWSRRMDLGVSVFDKNVKLPDSCSDFSVIPKNHLDWYKTIFIDNDRSVPPYAESTIISSMIVKVISSKDVFDIKKIEEYNESIKHIYYLGNKRFVVTTENIYYQGKKVNEDKLSKVKLKMCNVLNQDPLVAIFVSKQVTFCDLNKTKISSIKAENVMEYNGILYSINNRQLVENSFEVLGKIIHQTNIVCNLTSSYKVFDGVIVQDDFGKCRLAIPFQLGQCINSHIEELDSQRVIDAKYTNEICILITEKKCDYFRHFIYFNVSHSDYKIISEQIDSIQTINFVVLPNSLCIFVDDDKLVLINKKKRKEFINPPINQTMKLHNEYMKVFFSDDNKLYSIEMK